MSGSITPTRRSFLTSSAAALSGLLLPLPALPEVRNATLREFQLRAGEGSAQLVALPHSRTPVWCYNDHLPGPEIRVRQGERLRIVFENGLREDTTVHWHGLRIPNAMDGVPYLTQRPVGPGESFVYEFDAVDAGTFWYHPHQRSFEQVGRGLYGPLIVEEPQPPQVDREITWILDDWRLTDAAEISDDFGNRHDMSHGGRFGNVVTINGGKPEPLAVRAGERLRLRLINAANARIFGLDFAALRPQIIALDGQPVVPHEPKDGMVVLGPAMRADLILDMAGAAGDRVAVVDRFYPRLSYRLTEFVYGRQAPRNVPPDQAVALPPNPLPEPDLATAERHDVIFNGGMMGQMVIEEMGGHMGSMMTMMRSGGMWFVNGVAADGHVMDPFLTLRRDRSHLIAMTNATAWPHPIHLHGHSFRVISRNGTQTPHREWQDTVLIAPRERVEIAFVADNPGDWMFHCHILEHQAAGMMGVIRVA